MPEQVRGSEEERIRLQAIAERIDLVRGWTEPLDEAQFLADLKLRDAVAMSLLVIGETARRLSEETKQRAQTVPWQAIISLRHRIAHGYETVDHRLIWQIARQDLPGLRDAIASLLKQD
jgi:uncharacterized protein with HEPN domain